MSGFNIQKMELTPAMVYWTPNASTTEYNLGATLGNIKIQVSTEKAEIKADQTGTTPLDRRISGHKYTVATNLAQVNDFSVLPYIFPSASALGATAAAIQWFNAVGHSDIAVAGKLRLHPMSVALTDLSRDWTFYVACPTENSEITYSATEQSQFKVEWGIYPDVNNPQSSGGFDFRFMRFGDKDL